MWFLRMGDRCLEETGEGREGGAPARRRVALRYGGLGASKTPSQQ